MNNLGQERYEEVSINGSKALVGNEVVAINHPNGQDWTIIHNTTSENQYYAADAGQFSHNNQVLLQQITASFRWNIP